MHNPKKIIPKAVIITLVSPIILYAGVAFVAVGGIGAEQLSSTGSPLGRAAASFDMLGVLLTGIGATTAMLGVLLRQFLGISRMMFVMARRRDLPAFLEKVQPVHKVPYIGIFISGKIVILLSIFGILAFVISAASFTILLYYNITNIAAMKMRKEHKLYPDAWVEPETLQLIY